MTSARGIGFEYRPSATLSRLAAGVVALATAAPLFTALPWYVRLPLAAAIALFGYRRLLAFRHPPVIALAWASDGVWTVTLPAGVEKVATLAGSRIFGTAVFLHLRWPGGAGQVAFLDDNARPDVLRQLRARLSTHNEG